MDLGLNLSMIDCGEHPHVNTDETIQWLLDCQLHILHNRRSNGHQIVHNASLNGCNDLVAIRSSMFSNQRPIDLVATRLVPLLEQGDVTIWWPLDHCMVNIGRPNNLVVIRLLPMIVFEDVMIWWPSNHYQLSSLYM